jgi:hypothetical protein
MATNLLKRLDALLDDGLVRGKKPLGATNCVRGRWTFIEDEDAEEKPCSECHKLIECEYFCFSCGEYFCSEDCLDSHYAHN